MVQPKHKTKQNTNGKFHLHKSWFDECVQVLTWIPDCPSDGQWQISSLLPEHLAEPSNSWEHGLWNEMLGVSGVTLSKLPNLSVSTHFPLALGCVLLLTPLLVHSELLPQRPGSTHEPHPKFEPQVSHRRRVCPPLFPLTSSALLPQGAKAPLKCIISLEPLLSQVRTVSPWLFGLLFFIWKSHAIFLRNWVISTKFHIKLKELELCFNSSLLPSSKMAAIESLQVGISSRIPPSASTVQSRGNHTPTGQRKRNVFTTAVATVS